MNDRLFGFTGGSRGDWVIDRIDGVIGESLANAERLNIEQGPSELGDTSPGGSPSSWRLVGITSNERYTTREEHDRLVAAKPPMGRVEATCGALIPIRKSAEWWKLSQAQRREIFEEQSGHISQTMKYLPAIARRLHHCRDLAGPVQPFDFLTWFEFAPEHAGAFEELVNMLRQTAEWRYVDREVDIRVHKPGA